MHDEPPLALRIFEEVFAAPRILLFSTPEEQDLAARRFGVERERARIVGAGVDDHPDADAERFRDGVRRRASLRAVRRPARRLEGRARARVVPRDLPGVASRRPRPRPARRRLVAAAARSRGCTGSDSSPRRRSTTRSRVPRSSSARRRTRASRSSRSRPGRTGGRRSRTRSRPSSSASRGGAAAGSGTRAPPSTPRCSTCSRGTSARGARSGARAGGTRARRSAGIGCARRGWRRSRKWPRRLARDRDPPAPLRSSPHSTKRRGRRSSAGRRRQAGELVEAIRLRRRRRRLRPAPGAFARRASCCRI